jgi:putative toxin-antitoxin system antitoxin component (TIGR02293 family)
MAGVKKQRAKEKTRSGATQLGIKTGDPVKLVRLIRAGFPFSSVARLQEVTELSWNQISQFVGIPQRTLTRRQSEGRLQPDESDRVWRAASLFRKAVDLFEGDAEVARQWLVSPQAGLGGETPLDFASTEVGAREVENLIGRLEHGVFT